MTTLAALTAIDWCVVGAYLVGIFIVGLFFTRRAGKNTAEFFISGRNLPWWLAGTSMVATAFSSDTPLVVTGWVRSGGVSENWFWWSFAIGGMFSVFLLSRLWRRAEVVTMVELTEMRYSGPSAAALRAVRGVYFALLVNCVSMAWTIVGMIKVMGTLLDINPLPAVIICICVTTLYTAFSGSWGVVVTDFIQFIIAMGGAIVLCVLALSGLGGLEAIRNDPALHERMLNFFPRPPATAELASLDFWSGGFMAFVYYVSIQWWANKNADGGSVVVQRMSSTKNERHSLLATLWFNVANYAVKPWPWILVALASLLAFPGEKDQEMAYPLMIKKFVPPGLVGLMVASFMAAFMSMINTYLNLSSSFFVTDVYKRFIRKGAKERHYVLAGRLASVMFMVISAVIALWANSISGLFKFLLAFASGIGSVYILKWFWWHVSAWSEIAAMIASAAISSSLYVYNIVIKAVAERSHAKAVLFSEALILAITAVGSGVVWIIVTFLTAPVEREKLLSFYRKVRPYGFWGDIARESGVTPPRDLPRLLLSWIAGTVMVLAATIAIGKLLLGESREGVIYLAAAAAGALVIKQTVLDAGRKDARDAAAVPAPQASTLQGNNRE